MNRTTISLPDDLAAAVQREARRRDIAISRLVREAIEAQLGRGGGRRPLAFARLGRSGQHDNARNADALLAREWSDARDR
jgi:predicted transcriptional regulator